MEVNKRARLVELECDEKWRLYWHNCGCDTIGDVLALEPDNPEARRHLAHLMRFELRYKRDVKHLGKLESRIYFIFRIKVGLLNIRFVPLKFVQNCFDSRTKPKRHCLYLTSKSNQSTFTSSSTCNQLAHQHWRGMSPLTY